MGRRNTVEPKVADIYDELDNALEDMCVNKHGIVKKAITDIRRQNDYNAIGVLTVIEFAVRHKMLAFADKQDKFFDKEFSFMKKTFDMSENESILLAMTYNCEDGNVLKMQNLYRLMGISFLQMQKWISVIDSLVQKGYIGYDANNQILYREDEAFKSVIKGEVFVPKDYSHESVDVLLDDMRRIIDIDNFVTYQSKFGYFCRKYKGHPLFTKLNNLFVKDYDCAEHQEVFLNLIINYVYGIYPSMSLNCMLDGISANYYERRSIIKWIEAIVNKTVSPFRDEKSMGFIENYSENGIANPNQFVLSEEGALFFGVNNLGLGDSFSNQYSVVKSTSVKEKQLFYENDTQKQVNRLFELLEECNFNSIQDRLSEHNMRVGFNVLFYGSAGTGKTETCLQLSKLTGRDIYTIEVNDFKSKFVGESEKCIKNLFVIYNRMVEDYKKDKKPIPIMLLNEADAVIGIRKKGAQSAVDKMENSIQNIILQEMENIKGIMIATTNLTENLDSAFERRFIYKVKFNRPSKEVKAKIWKSNLPELDNDSIDKLSEEYDFSGGEIENIVRKTTIETILSGAELSYDLIKEFSDTEKLANNQKREKVGFR